MLQSIHCFSRNVALKIQHLPIIPTLQIAFTVPSKSKQRSEDAFKGRILIKENHNGEKLVISPFGVL